MLVGRHPCLQCSRFYAPGVTVKIKFHIGGEVGDSELINGGSAYFFRLIFWRKSNGSVLSDIRVNPNSTPMSRQASQRMG